MLDIKMKYENFIMELQLNDQISASIMPLIKRFDLSMSQDPGLPESPT